MEATQQMALTQMRKSVQKLGSCTEEYGDPTLKRFLTARSMNPKKAAKMFVQWQKWRAAFVPGGSIPDSEIPDELEPKKIYLQGLSKDGYPVLLAKVCKHVPGKDQVQFKKFVVYVLDKAIASAFNGREIGNEKLVVIIDLYKIAYKNVDVRGFIAGLQLLQDYYPDRLAKCFMLNMPWFFVSAWRIITHVLDKATLEKIVIVANEEERKKFMKEVNGGESLPEEYGGRGKLTPLQDVILRPLES